MTAERDSMTLNEVSVPALRWSRSVATRPPGPAAPDRPRTRRLWPSRSGASSPQSIGYGWRRRIAAHSPARWAACFAARGCTARIGRLGARRVAQGLAAAVGRVRRPKPAESAGCEGARARGAWLAWSHELHTAHTILDVQGKVAARLLRIARTRNALLIAVQPLAAQVGVAPAAKHWACHGRASVRGQLPGTSCPVQRPPGRCVKPASRSSMCSPARASSTVRRRRSWRRCSTKAITCARSGRCIGSWPPISRSESGAISASIPSTPKPERWPRRRTRPGPGTSPSCWGRPSGRTSTSMLDIFSRYAVGWMVADRENSAMAGRLGPATNRASRPPQALHSDRGRR